MLPNQRTTIVCTMLLALGACKVSAGTSDPDASRPHVAPGGDEGGTPGDTLVDNAEAGGDEPKQAKGKVVDADFEVVDEEK